MGLAEDHIRRVHAVKSGPFDVDKQIEAALRRIDDAQLRDLVDPLRRVEHSLSVLFDHRRLHFVPVVQGEDRGALGNRRRCEHHVLIDLLDDLDDVVRRDDVAHSPSGHGEVL